MAHAIDFSKGSPAFVAYKESAWHKLGTVITEQPEHMLDILEPAGLDYTVAKAPNTMTFPSGKVEVSADSYFTFRTDIEKVLGSHVGSGYTIMQNVESLGILEPFFKDNRISFESAGALKDGRWTFVCCRFVDPIEVGKNDEVANYFVIFNSFDGTLAIQAYFTPIRVVCNNTLQMSLKGAKQRISIRHTANLKDRLQEATKILLAGEQNAALFGEKAISMKKASWTDSKFFDYVANVYCSKKELTDLAGGKHPLEVISTRKRGIINATVNFAFDGVGQKEAVEGSAWWAYNAVTGYYSNEKNFKTEDARAESLYFGGSSRQLETALALAQPEAKMMPVGLASSLN